MLASDLAGLAVSCRRCIDLAEWTVLAYAGTFYSSMHDDLAELREDKIRDELRDDEDEVEADDDRSEYEQL